MPPALFLASKEFSIFCVSETVSSAVDLLCQNPACFPGSCISLIGSTRVRISLSRILYSAPINSRLNVVVRSTIPYGLGRKNCWASRRPQLPRALSSDPSDLYNSTVQPDLPLLMLPFRPILVFKPLISLLPILYHLLLLPLLCLLILAVLLRFLFPLTPSGLCNGMRAVSEPGARNCYTFFRPISLTLSVSRNSILTHLPLSGSLDSLLCNLIALTPGLAFSLVMARTLAVTSSFSSGRAYHSGEFQLPSPLLGLKRYFRPRWEGSIRLGYLF